MTHFKKCDTGKLCLFLASLLLSCQEILAQDYQTLRQNTLDKLDLSGLGDKLFMNAAVTTRHEIDYLKQISSGKLSKPEPVSAEEWHNLYERIVDADLRANHARIPALHQLAETDPSGQPSANPKTSSRAVLLARHSPSHPSQSFQSTTSATHSIKAVLRRATRPISRYPSRRHRAGNTFITG